MCSELVLVMMIHAAEMACTTGFHPHRRLSLCEVSRRAHAHACLSILSRSGGAHRALRAWAAVNHGAHSLSLSLFFTLSRSPSSFLFPFLSFSLSVLLFRSLLSFRIASFLLLVLINAIRIIHTYLHFFFVEHKNKFAC